MTPDRLVFLPNPIFFWGLVTLGVVALVLAYYWRKSRTERGNLRSAITFIWGILCLSVLAPTMRTARTELTDKEFISVKGLWFSPRTESFRYAEVKSLRFEDAAYDRPMFIVSRKGGGGNFIGLSESEINHLGEIVPFLRARGVVVVMPEAFQPR